MEVVTNESTKTASSSSRLAYLLGEMRRQMNGAVVGSMRFYGDEYGLNYGVSLPTIRSIAKEERSSCDDQAALHRLSHLLYRQEVRELRIAGLWLADSEKVDEELDFWAKGVINSEVAEEAAFALLYHSDLIDNWLDGDSELLQYCALMSIAKRDVIDIERYWIRISDLIKGERHILQNGVVALLESAIRRGTQKSVIEKLLTTLREDDFIRQEMTWRVEFL